MGIGVAAAALAAAVSLSLSACMENSPALQGQFAERSGEPSGIRMPDAKIGDAMPAPGAKREPRGTSDPDPCAIDDVVLAACMPEITAIASPGKGRAIAATADGRLHLIVAGAEPREIADAGSRVAQITAGPTVAEDGQMFLLRADGSVARLTLLPGGRADLRDLPEHRNIGNIGLFLDDSAQVNTLLAGDPGIEVISMCHGPHGAPPLMTVRLDGTPMLAQWSYGRIEPLGGVDLDDSIGGCAVAGTDVFVAVPGAQRVVSVPIAPPEAGRFGAWKVMGSPKKLLEGEYGHVGWLAPVLAEGGAEVWGATVNKADGRDGGESDERIFRIPSGGAAGGSPD